MKLSLTEIAAEVIDAAKHLNIEAALTLYQSAVSELSLRHGQFDELVERNYREAQLTVYTRHRLGRASVTTFTPKVLFKALDKAKTMAELSQPDPARMLPDISDLAFNYSADGLDLYHPNYPVQTELRSTFADLEIAAGQNLSAGTTLDTETIAFSAANAIRLIANTRGFCGSVTATYYNAMASFVAEKATAKVRGSAYIADRNFKRLNFDQLINKAKKRTLMSLDAKTIKPQNLPVIFAASVAVSLFYDLIDALTGRNIYYRTSFLTNRLRELVLAPHLTIVSDPSLPAALGSKPFDSEGVKVQPITLIEKGILANYLLDSYSARRLKLANNGHAGGIHNVRIISSQPKIDFESLLQEMRYGILVTELMGGNTNLLTGHYTCGIFGYEIKDGKIIAPIKGATITGNLADIFKDIVAISDDCENNSKILTGSILIKRLAVSGSS